MFKEKIVAVAIDEYAASWVCTGMNKAEKKGSSIPVTTFVSPQSATEYFSQRLQVKLRGENFELEMKKKATMMVFVNSLHQFAPMHSYYVSLFVSRPVSEKPFRAFQDPVQIDSRLEDVVNRMFQRCLEDRQWSKLIAFESCSMGGGIGFCWWN